MARQTVVAARAPSIPPQALPFGQRVVQYRRLRRGAKVDLLHLSKSYGVALPANHLTAGDPPDAAVTAAMSGPSGQPQSLSAAERDAVNRILKARTSKKLAELHKVIPPSVYASGPVSAFEAAQGRVIVADGEREAAYNNYCKQLGRPLPPQTIIKPSRPPASYNTIGGAVPMDFWGTPLADVGGIDDAGSLECGAPQTGHGVQGQPCNCVLGEDLTCYYHP